MAPYRPGQGIYARGAAGGAGLLLILFACARLFRMTLTRADFKLLGVTVPHAALWSAGLFIVLAVVVFLCVFGAETHIKGLDGKTHALIDLLIDTESELTKVSWPSSEQLTMSTTAVLVCIVLLGTFIFCMGLFIGFVMGRLGVLPS